MKDSSSVLGFIFITLKLLGYLDWSWWLVLLPFLFPLGIAIVAFSFLMLCYLIEYKWNFGKAWGAMIAKIAEK